RFEAEVLRAQAVMHVAYKFPLFDENARFWLVSFVVNVDGAARLEERGVVDDRAKWARDLVADLPRVVARPLAVEVGFEAVTDRFVEQDAAIARRKHDFHLSRGRLDRVKHRERLLRGLRGVPFRRLRLEIPERRPSTAARRTFLALAVFLGNHANSEANERLRV